MRVNYSQNISYHSQRNNELIPYSSCNTTAMIMALIQAGYESEVYGKAKDLGYKQPEDALTSLFDFANGENEHWAKIPAKVNAFIGRDVCCLNWRCSYDEIVEQLSKGGGCMIGGLFAHYKEGEIGHFVSVAGHYDDFMGQGLIIDDPYGSYLSGYNPKMQGYNKGNDIDLPLSLFKAKMRDTAKTQRKWAFLIQKNG